MAFKDLRSHI
jgi:hypothetical protein